MKGIKNRKQCLVTIRNSMNIPCLFFVCAVKITIEDTVIWADDLSNNLFLPLASSLFGV